MNAFIFNYLKYDISERAIMLTGEWGSGKSFYIKNTLKPFLEDKDQGNSKCVIVSLYGLSDVSEISKAIFLELHPVIKKSDSAVGSAAKAVGKTLLNGLTSVIGFDIGSPDNDGMLKIYESVDLADTLVVLEDIERTQIDMIKLLGYVNNLCENDGVKILLVTNESELLTTCEKTDEKGNKIKCFTEDAIAYKRTKEKTIGDTIYFFCDFVTTIKSIIHTFGIYLQKYNNDEKAQDIFDIFILLNSYNLRAFIYGCQKCKSIFKYLEEKKIVLSENIADIIFYGVTAFTQRQCKGIELTFDSNAYLSEKLGLNERWPLFRFCYDFIMFQTLSEAEIRQEITYYNEYLRKGKWNSGRDSDLQIIRNFNIKTESEVRTALANIPEKIRNGLIPYHDYGVLVNYVVAIRYDAEIEIDIESITKPILESMKMLEDNINIEALFSSGYTLYNHEAIIVFENIKQQMNNVLHGSDEIEFMYDPNSIIEFCKNNTSRLRDGIKRERFIRSLDMKLFISMLQQCTSEQISSLRSLFIDLYGGAQPIQINEKELSVLQILSQDISEYKKWERCDKIQQMQLKWFERNLNKIIDSLNFDT